MLRTFLERALVFSKTMALYYSAVEGATVPNGAFGGRVAVYVASDYGLSLWGKTPRTPSNTTTVEPPSLEMRRPGRRPLTTAAVETTTTTVALLWEEDPYEVPVFVPPPPRAKPPPPPPPTSVPSRRPKRPSGGGRNPVVVNAEPPVTVSIVTAPTDGSEPQVAAPHDAEEYPGTWESVVEALSQFRE